MWSSVAENVATASGGTQPSATALAQLMVEGWMNSPPHRANILNGGFTDTGVGCTTGTPPSPRAGQSMVFICVAMFGRTQ